MNSLKIVKIGGNIIDDKEALSCFLSHFSKIKSPKILIHGGGILATELANKMNINTKLIEGRRVTDRDTLDIITMVYAGKINKNIITKLQANGTNCVGFSGADGNTIISEKRPVVNVDYGLVGDVKQVNIKVPKLLLDNNITPVFCAISHDEKGQLLNTNADTIASELAINFAALYNVELYYCFEKNGVLLDVNDDVSVIENINKNSYHKLISEGVIADGMLPKLKNCIRAIENHVTKVCIGKPDMLFTTKSKHTTIQA